MRRMAILLEFEFEEVEWDDDLDLEIGGRQGCHSCAGDRCCERCGCRWHLHLRLL